MESFKIFQAVRKLCDEYPGEAEDLKPYLQTNDDEEEEMWSDGYINALLDCVSDVLLNETCTEMVAILFGPLLLDLFSRCAKDIKEDFAKHESICRMLATLIWTHADAQKFVYQYCANSPSIFVSANSEDSADAPRKRIRLEEHRLDLDLRKLLLAALKFLSFDFCYFRDLWDWSALSHFLRHSDEEVVWLSHQCLLRLANIPQKEHNAIMDSVLDKSFVLKMNATYSHVINPIQSYHGYNHAECPSSAVCIADSELSTSVINVQDVLLEKFVSEMQLDDESPIVTVSGTMASLHELALAVAAGCPVLIQGPVGSGKTSLIEHLAYITGRHPQFDVLKVQLADQMDSKLLVGSYCCKEMPGEFEWQPGVVTRAMTEGRWLLLEDIDCAPMDVITTLAPIIESSTLLLPGQVTRTRAAPGFQVFATVRLSVGHDRFYSGFRTNCEKLRKLMRVITLQNLDCDELLEIISDKWSALMPIADRILKIYNMFSSDTNTDDNMEKSPHLSSLTRGRLISTRDLFKFCKRIEVGFNLQSCETSLTAFQHALDCFTAGIPQVSNRISASEYIGTYFNIPKTKAGYYCVKHKPSVEVYSDRVQIGRAVMPIKPQTPSLIRRAVPSFAYTRQANYLLERVLVAVECSEPVLLVGETGTGKTSLVQFLSHLTNNKLTVINMNQQSDSVDLIGGYKPVDLQVIVAASLLEKFNELFPKTFSAKQNLKFLGHISKCFLSKRWDDLFELMISTQKAAVKRKETQKPGEKGLLKSWTELGQRLTQLKIRLKESKGAMFFSFIEGALVKAVKQGEWILLDEINLAEAETLQCLSSVLEGCENSLHLLERGDKEPVRRSSDFRIFACMNPATDVGKRDLPTGIRNRFTEFFVEELEKREDLLILVESYLSGLALNISVIERCVDFYLYMKRGLSQKLSDGTGHTPHYSLRTLCRALTCAARNLFGGIFRSLFEGFALSFLSQVDCASHDLVYSALKNFLLDKSHLPVLTQKIPEPTGCGDHVSVEGFWIPIGKEKISTPESYVLTSSVKHNLQNLARIVSAGDYPVLLQGETSVGKTSLVQYLAQITGNMCVRVNNHDHTDIEEYVGSYSVDDDGRLLFKEGILVQAMRKGYWLILDELNLAPTEVMEALNRVLDDNRELFIAETQKTIRAHPKFRVFATQNPPGLYGGRKILSRAFRNRFIELYFDEIPIPELEIILSERCAVPASYAKHMVAVMQDLQLHRSQSGIFRGKQGFITLRDLFRWGERYRLAPKIAGTFYDWLQHLADEGYMLLAGRVRQDEEDMVIQQSIQKHMKRKVDPSKLFAFNAENPTTSDIVEHILSGKMSEEFKHVVFTPKMRRMAILLGKALKFKEPVLLVGNTGCGKTTMCQIFAELAARKIHIVNCHMHSESADFLGSLRPVRAENMDESKLLEWQDGPLVLAMKNGSYFLTDEISLADDSVLERLNSVLEPSRELRVTERCCDDNDDKTVIRAEDDFRIMATMNPGGDYGKKELSPALRNRFTEIWCPSDVTNDEFLSIIERNITANMILDSSLVGSGFGQAIVDFLDWFRDSGVGRKITISIRDILTWANFINKTVSGSGKDGGGCLSPCEAFIHGACLIFLDSLGSSTWGTLSSKSMIDVKEKIYNYLEEQIDRFAGGNDVTALKQSLLNSWSSYCYKEKFINRIPYFGFGPFLIPTRENSEIRTPDGYNLDAATTKSNAVRILRAMQLRKPILLEGSPGVGKTSLIATLANTGAFDLVRINLSEHTDISDLFGKDLPVDGGKSGHFAWHDGPLLEGLKDGSWILLDEINLASQSVLEGLNACLDHRGEIYIPELGQTFCVGEHPTTRIFACQNPFRHGGSRKGLPQSFLNRFTQVFLEPLSTADMKLIVTYMYPSIPSILIAEMIEFNEQISSYLTDGRGVNMSWTCNLRDIFRWCDLMISDQFEDRYNPATHVGLIYADRMRTYDEKNKIYEMRQIHFGLTDDSLTRHLDLHVSDALVQIGSSFLQRKHASLEKGPLLYPLHCQLPYLESLMKCIEKNWLAILVGPASSGKTSMVRLLSDLTANPLKVINVNSEMDTLELLGGFEQMDLDRHVDEVVEQLEPYLQKAFIMCINDEYFHGYIADLLKNLHELRRLSLEKNNFNTYPQRSLCIDKIVETIIELDEEFRDPLTELKRRTWEIFVSVSKRMSKGFGRFEWVDSVLVKAMKKGYWVLMEDVNLCSPSVLDRLNSLFEPGGFLSIAERGSIENDNSSTDDEFETKIETIKPHPDFRIVFTMDPKNGEISPAMRNRGVEIAIPVEITTFDDKETSLREWDISSLMHSKQIADPHVMFCLSKIFRILKGRSIDDGPLAQHFHVASNVCLQLLQKGKTMQNALFNGYDIAFMRSIFDQKIRKKTFTFLRDKLNKDLGPPWEPLEHHKMLSLVPSSSVDYQHSYIFSSMQQRSSLFSYLIRTFMNGLLSFPDPPNAILLPGPPFKFPSVTETKKWILIFSTALRIFIERSSTRQWYILCMWFDTLVDEISNYFDDSQASEQKYFAKVFFPLRDLIMDHYHDFMKSPVVLNLVSTMDSISTKTPLGIDEGDLLIDPRWNTCFFQKVILEFYKKPENHNFDIEEVTQYLYAGANRWQLLLNLTTVHSLCIVVSQPRRSDDVENLKTVCLYDLGVRFEEQATKEILPHPCVEYLPRFVSCLQVTLSNEIRSVDTSDLIEYFWEIWNVIKVYHQFLQFCKKPVADIPSNDLVNVFSLHCARMIKELTQCKRPNGAPIGISEETENLIAVMVNSLGLENMVVQKIQFKTVSRFGFPPAFPNDNIAKLFSDIIEIHDKANIYGLLKSANSMEDLKVVFSNGLKWYQAMVKAVIGCVSKSGVDSHRFSEVHEIQLQLRDLGFMGGNDDDDIMEVCQQPATVANVNENQLLLHIQMLPFWEYFFLHSEAVLLNSTMKKIQTGMRPVSYKLSEKFVVDLGINKLNYDPVHIGQLLTLQKDEKALFPVCFSTFLNCLQNGPLCGNPTICFNWGKKEIDKKLEPQLTWDKQSPLLTMSCVRLLMNTNCSDPDALPLKNFTAKKQQIEMMKMVLWRSRESLGKERFWHNLSIMLFSYFDYLVAVMSTLIKSKSEGNVTEILERMWSELKLAEILKYGEANMLVDARDCILNMTATAINGDFMDSNWSIGLSFAKVGLLTSMLFSPIYSHDPVQKHHLTYSCCSNQLHDCLMELHFHDWLSIALEGRSLQDVQNDIHPFLSGLSSIIAKLKEKGDKVKGKLSYRPSPSQYPSLVKEIQQFLGLVGSPSAAHALIDMLCNLRNKAHEKTLSDNQLQKTLQGVNTYVKSVKSFVSSLTAKFLPFRDLLYPFLTGIEMLLMGVQMMGRHLSIYALRENFPKMKSAESILIRACSFPAVTESDVATTPFQLASFLGDTETLQCIVGLKESVKLEKNDGCLAKLLRSALAEILNEVVILKSTPPSNILEAAESILMCFYRALEKQNEEEQRKKEEDESLYSQKVRTYGEELSEEEQLAKNLKLLFPKFDKEFADLVEGSLDMYVEEESPVESEVELDIKREDIMEVWRCHATLIANTPPFQREEGSGAPSPVAKFIDRPDFHTPFLIRYDILKKLLPALNYIDSSIDSHLVGGHLVAASALQLQEDIQNSSRPVSDDVFYDIYHDSNPNEALQLILVLEALVSHVNLILKDFPENPILLQLLLILERIQSFPVTSPVMKFVTGLEMVLDAAQAWEQVAHKGNSLKIELDAITRKVLYFRQLENKCLSLCLEHVLKREYGQCAKWWYHIYSVAFVQKEEKMTSLLTTLKQFIEDSTLGQFRPRMEMLHTFVCHLSFTVNTQYKKHVRDVMLNVYSFYKQFLSLVSDKIDALKIPLEKEVADFVKIAKWNESNYFSIKKSVEKTHQMLNKCMHKFQVGLQQPVRPFFQLVHGEVTISQQLMCPLDIISQSNVPVIENAEGKIPTFANEQLFDEVPAYYRKSRKLCKKTIKNFSLSKHILAVDTFTASIVSKLQHTKSLEIKKGGGKKAEMKHFNHNVQLKKKALSDALKDLKRIGLSYRKGLIYSEKSAAIDEMSPMLTPGLSTLIWERLDKALRFKDFNISSTWEETNAAFYKCIAQFAHLESSLLSPDRKLRDVETLKKFKGFSAHALQNIVQHRHRLSREAPKIAGFNEAVESLVTIVTNHEVPYAEKVDDLYFPPQDFVAMWKGELSNFLVQTYAALQQFDTLLGCCPKANEDHNIVLQPQPSSPLAGFVKEDKLWSRLVGDVHGSLDHIKDLIRSTQLILKGDCELHTWSHFSQIRENFEQLADLVEKFAQANCTHFHAMSHSEDVGTNFTSFFFNLHASIKSHWDRFSNEFEEVYQNDVSTMTQDELNVASLAERLLRKVLKTLENIYVYAAEYSQPGPLDDTEEEVSQLDLYTKMFSENMEKFSQSLNIPIILSLLKKVMSRLPMFETFATKIPVLERYILSAVPILQQYLVFVRLYFSTCILGQQVSCKLLTSMLQFFIEFADNGFGDPPHEATSKDSGKADFRDIEQGGLGEGEGVQDVSKDIESEDQLEGAQLPGAEPKDEERSDIKDEDDGIEMSEDFEGKAYDPVKGEDEGKDEQEDQEIDEDELEKKMGDVEDADADKLDEQLWADENEDDGDDELNEDECGKGTAQEKTSELVAKDSADKEEESSKNNNNLADKCPDLKNEGEYDGEHVDPLIDAPPLLEPEVMDLPEKMQLEDTGDDNEEDEDTEGNDMEIDTVKEDDEEATNEYENIEESIEKPDTDLKDQSDIEIENDIEKGVPEEILADDPSSKSVEEPEKKDDVALSGGETSKPSGDKVEAADSKTGSSRDLVQGQEEEEELDVWEGGAMEDEGQHQEGQGASNESKHADAGEKGDKRSAPSTGFDDVQRHSKKMRSADQERTLGDVEKTSYERLDVKEASSKRQEKSGKSSDYEHVKEGNEQDQQAMDAATREQVALQPPPLQRISPESDEDDDLEDEEEEDEEDDDDVIALDSSSEDESSAADQKTELPAGVADARRRSMKNAAGETDEFDEGLDVDKDGEIVPSYTFPQQYESTIHTQFDLYECLAPEDQQKLRIEIEEKIGALKEGKARDPELMHSLWQSIETSVAPHVQELCEQLRLVLEPTKMSKMKGDYRTGKRLNMRKIIPYIASQFRKDKIWLRRTKASRREYQIMLAVDDSYSMSDNHSKELAYESLALLGKALSIIESGELAVVSFGEEVEVVQDFGENFSHDTGARIVESFSFEQSKTNIRQLIEYAQKAMTIAKRQPSKLLAKEIAQLLIIISDGRGIFNEGEDALKLAVRQAMNNNIFMVFVVLDSPTNKDSILDIQRTAFDNDGNVQLKSYLESFPFPFYVILRSIDALPHILGEALRQWFELVTATER